MSHVTVLHHCTILSRWVCVFVLFMVTPLLGETFLLKEPPVINTPEIRDNKIFYSVDFMFDRVPPNFWLFYDNNDSGLSMIFYSAEIRYQPTDTILSNTALIKNFRIEKSETAWSLSSYQTSFLLTIDSGWHYRTEMPDSTQLRLELWKEIKIKELEKPGKQPYLLYIASATGAALITFLIIMQLSLRG